MTLAEVLSASVVLMLGCSSAAQLWSKGFQSGADLAQREALMDRLERLLVASEGTARQLAKTSGPEATCQAAANKMVAELQTLQEANPPATLTFPEPNPANPLPAGLLRVRWESGGVQRERLLSLSAVGLCQEGASAT
ncbi:MAG: hypothetical protein VKM17_07120 [Cyanobacteriota bacterium]|nr:hypothetical protein [Cyanobacteriota bacterium]